jgi:hypothetical protein
MKNEGETVKKKPAFNQQWNISPKVKIAAVPRTAR